MSAQPSCDEIRCYMKTVIHEAWKADGNHISAPALACNAARYYDIVNDDKWANGELYTLASETLADWSFAGVSPTHENANPSTFDWIVGADVVMLDRGNESAHKIARTTRTMLVLDDGDTKREPSRFWRSNLREVGSAHSYLPRRIVPATPDALARVRDEERLAKLRHRIRFVKLERASETALAELEALLDRHWGETK